jgi:hypothetical protein
MQCGLSPSVRQLIIFSEYPDLTIYNYFAQPEKVKVMSNWDEVVALLKKSHPGRAAVAIYPNADIQYCSTSSGSKVLSFFSRD